MTEFECPNCSVSNIDSLITSIHDGDSTESVRWLLIDCSDCGTIYWVNVNVSEYSIAIETVTTNQPGLPVNIPPIPIGETVYLINRAHPRHLDPGVVVKKDHEHYRLEFLDGVLVWVPKHWVILGPDDNSRN